MGNNNKKNDPGVPPVEGTEVSIEEKIKQQAEKYFDSYPNSKAIFATKDGNFWLDTIPPTCTSSLYVYNALKEYVMNRTKIIIISILSAGHKLI